MGVKLELGDVDSGTPQPPAADQPQPEPQPPGDDKDLIDYGLKTLRRLNEGIKEYKEFQQNMNQLAGQTQTQQQPEQQPIQDRPQGGTPSVGEQPDIEGEPAQQTSQGSQQQPSLLEQIPAEVVHDYVMKSVNHLEDELGRDATLEDAEVWLMENQQELVKLIRQGKQVLKAQYGN